jgi:hypothetical protein
MMYSMSSDKPRVPDSQYRKQGNGADEADLNKERLADLA